MADTPTPTPTPTLTDAFERERGRLRAVALRMLGSHADAEDVVQEAWLRLSRQDAAEIGNLAGWLTIVVGRLSLDVLRTRQTHPVASSTEAEERMLIVLDEAPAPDEDAVLADAVGTALLVVLDSLAPSERLAFVLHDLFAVSFDEIGRIIGKSADAAKMTASRARRKVRAGGRVPPAAGAREQRAAVDAFLAAAREGDFEALLRVLDPAVKLDFETAEGKVVLLGATEVAAGARRAAGAASRGVAVYVDGLPGIAAFGPDGRVISVMAFTVEGGRIVGMHGVTDPARLAAVEVLGAA
ncbi:sigma-70 family RNA polymerase sigma factor [Actinospica robiniae]|uniref:RNA polymerase sigma factor, sigma-70 family n=1 Tax=Actinospica robiniae DSM 44927 TaxID=479430 RepID=W9E4Y0_9ACTN|nr:sigma-70 family RNA polymerase sigma factor [Actinospica robiniae]ETA71026.1 RNA polymerase sigma factor, sigma-70 family [Actinospica robiniae DSM 44927]